MTTSQETSTLHKLRGVFAAFQQIDETMPIQIAHTFVVVALFEGRSMREYCQIAGAQQSTMSRHLLDLGEFNRKKAEGHKLIEQRVDPTDFRRHLYTLTPKGRRLLAQLASLMEK